jgi:hypothetical protein
MLQIGADSGVMHGSSAHELWCAGVKPRLHKALQKSQVGMIHAYAVIKSSQSSVTMTGLQIGG